MTWTKEQHREYMREYRKKNHKYLLEQRHKWVEENRDTLRQQARERAKTPKQQEYKRKYDKTRYAIDPLHREKIKALKRKEYYDLRDSIFNQYGRKCAKCPYSLVEALHLDHKNSDGYLEREKHSTGWIYRNALKEPERYQLLCPNCNNEKRLANKEFPKRKNLIGS